MRSHTPIKLMRSDLEGSKRANVQTGSQGYRNFILYSRSLETASALAFLALVQRSE
jgi:hypothetical protein